MSGFDNEVVYAVGERLEPTTAQAIQIMQKTASDVSNINHTGNPEGVVSANPSSISHDPVSGNIYLKQTGTGTTGWVLIGTTAGDLHTSAFIVSASGIVGTGANYSTIASAVAAASSGDTIFIMRGTYTENITVTKNLIFYSYDTSFRTANPNVQITGKITVSSAVNVQFFGIQFNTNADNSFLLSAAGNVTCQNCYFNATNANSILVSAAGNFYIENCSGSFALNRSLFRSTAGVVWLKNSVFIDFVNSPVANTILDSTARIINCYLGIKFITQGTGGIIVENSNFGSENAYDAIWITISGSGNSFVDNSTFNSGAAACIEVTTTLTITNCRLESSQNFVITGAGTVTYGPLTFSGATSVMQATQVPLITQVGSLNILTPSTVTSPQTMVRDSVTGAVGVSSGGGGGVTGPGSSTDRAISTWDGTGGTALFDNSTTNIDSTGRFTNSAQPAFSAYAASGFNSVTGDGTIYTIPFDTVLVNRGSYYNTSNGVFTAPVTGVYYFCAAIQFNNVVAQNVAYLDIVAGGVSYVCNLVNPLAIVVAGQMALVAHCVAPMNVNDTAVCQVTFSGSSGDVNISSGASSIFGGYLIA
jgi:hypothetical protein